MTATPRDLEDAIAALVAAVVALVRSAMPAADPEPWITIADGAAYAGCSEDLMRELVDSGVLPAGRLGARSIRLRRSEIDRALLSHAATTGQGKDVNDAVVQRVLSSLGGAGAERPMTLAIGETRK